MTERPGVQITHRLRLLGSVLVSFIILFAASWAVRAATGLDSATAFFATLCGFFAVVWFSMLLLMLFDRREP